MGRDPNSQGRKGSKRLGHRPFCDPKKLKINNGEPPYLSYKQTAAKPFFNQRPKS